MQKTTYNPEKMYTFLKGYANGRNMEQTLYALGFARKKHEGQKRKSGEPYLIHPVMMACNAISLGIKEDDVIATILLHDVIEETGVSPEELPVNDNVRRAVGLMTFTVMDGESKEIAKTRYYNLIPTCREAVITKLVDRCNNVSSMAGTFSIEKLKSYIEETRTYVLPLVRKAKDAYPEYSNALFALKYQIVSVVDAIDCTIAAYEGQTQ